MDSSVLNVRMDPRIIANSENLAAREKIVNEMLHYIETATDLYDQISDAQQSVERVLSLTAEDTTLVEIKKLSGSMKDSLKVFTEIFKGKDVEQGLVIHDNLLMHYLYQAQSYVYSSEDAPGETPKICIALFKDKYSKALGRISRFFENEWIQYQQKVEQQNIKTFKKFRKIELSN